MNFIHGFYQEENVAIIAFIVLLFIGVMFCIVLKLNGNGKLYADVINEILKE
jgi:TM2 domain-containing membrane protein YozV